VLYALQRPYSSDDEIRQGTQSLIAQWRARIEILTDRGWQAGKTGRPAVDTISRCNCLPAFAIATERTRSCGYSNICPFCYARRVRELWNIVDPLCQGRESQPAPKVKLVFRKVINYFDIPESRSEFSEALAATLPAVVAERSAVVKQSGALGVIAGVTLAPGTEFGMEITQQQVFAMSASAAFPATLQQIQHGYTRTLPTATRREANRAVGRLFRYPTGLLREDPAIAADILNTCTAMRFRGIERYRAFRRGAFETFFED